MQLIVLETGKHLGEEPLVEAMLRLRAKVFAKRLNWQVELQGELERDRFDDESPTYILLVEIGEAIVGCVRLLPAVRCSMLCEVFPELLDGQGLLVHERMVESSRFCIDKMPSGGPDDDGFQSSSAKITSQAGGSVVNIRTRMLLAAILEWSLSHGYEEVVTATDLRLERLLRLAGWPLKRLGTPKLINETRSVAGSLAVSAEILLRLKPQGYPNLIRFAAGEPVRIS